MYSMRSKRKISEINQQKAAEQAKEASIKQQLATTLLQLAQKDTVIQQHATTINLLKRQNASLMLELARSQ